MTAATGATLTSQITALVASTDLGAERPATAYDVVLELAEPVIVDPAASPRFCALVAAVRDVIDPANVMWPEDFDTVLDALAGA